MSSFRIWQLSARKLTQDATLEELQELEQLLRDHPELASQLELHGLFFNAGQGTASTQDPEVKEAWRRQLRAMREADPGTFVNTRQKGRRLWWAGAVLGVVVLTLGYFWAQQRPAKGKDMPDVHDMAIESGNTRHEVTLPDGSRAILNQNSHITLSKGFGKTNRNLRLEGEVFFDVVHDAQLPFTVQAATIQVKVLGTAFNVRAYEDEHLVQTALIRGAVEITDKINKKLRIRLKPNEKVSIQINDANSRSDPAGDTGILFKMEPLHKEEATGMIPETAWIQDKLMFNSEPLAEVAKKLEKWYKVSILIDNERLKEERFTGVFEKETIGEALTALQVTYPFQYRITGKTVIIQ
ncbi:FecR family protein [Niabella aurantiaca]|uniref:FecR family protein n=1 Tax=Niabella aurantiaca TaxID=379900 RepID=UPI00036BB52C|nr:FecR domain-containing protein [Niabella aurantiaca]